MAESTREDPPYVRMSVPGVGERWLPEGTLFCPVSPALIRQLEIDDKWSDPVRVKLIRTSSGLVDLYFKKEVPNG